MIIYVAGPYSAPDDAGRIANVEAAFAVADVLLKAGHTPFIPHIHHYYDLWHRHRYGERAEYALFMEWGLQILQRCDALYYLGPSPGADIERRLAKELGLPIFRSLDEVPVVPTR